MSHRNVRRWSWGWSWSLAWCLAAVGVCAEPPNVVLVLVDDMGYGDLSWHGNPILRTPHLDRWHDQSVRLTDFHAAPMCTPTRSQLLTGVDCLRNGAMNVSSGRTLLRLEHPTLANLLAQGGYATGQFGKWHLGDNYPYRPQDRGFAETLFFPSSHVGSAPDFWNNDYFDDTYHHNGARRQFTGYCTDVFFQQAINWMRTCAQRRQPFFAYLATNAPHGPLFVPAEYRKLYEGRVPPNVARFFGMLANLDDNIGRLELFLQESGQRDNTIVVFLTDNGGTAGVPIHNAGLRGKKIDLYDGGHRVPCFIRWPAGKLRSAGNLAKLTQAQDLLPTLLELCGQPLPADLKIDGHSLAPLLRGQADHLPDRTLVVQFSRMQQPRPERGDACVLWRKWRLVQDRELYDVSRDPAQRQNLIEEHPAVAAQLRRHYDRWWSGVAPRVNQYQAIVLGSEKENPQLLSPADWEDSFLDQGRQVREGLRRNGVWNVEVAVAGTYEISLRRWPEEAGAALRAGLPVMRHADGEFPAGAALPIARGRLQVAGQEQSQAAAADDQALIFRCQLPQGRTQLATAFLDAAGQEICGAYYVSVRKLP